MMQLLTIYNANGCPLITYELIEQLIEDNDDNFLIIDDSVQIKKFARAIETATFEKLYRNLQLD